MVDPPGRSPRCGPASGIALTAVYLQAHLWARDSLDRNSTKQTLPILADGAEVMRYGIPSPCEHHPSARHLAETAPTVGSQYQQEVSHDSDGCGPRHQGADF